MDFNRHVVLRLPRGGGTRGPGQAHGGIHPAQVNLEVESVSDRHKAELSRDGGVQAIARVMSTSLIAPMSSGEDVTHPAGWGIEMTGVARSAFDGSGVVAAVLDTGIDECHPAFLGMRIEAMDFTCTGSRDGNGHGTHCAGVFFGRDVRGVRIGVARGIDRALVGKVLRDDGSGETEMLFRGMQWALAGKANVLSVSLGFDFAGYVEGLVADGWPVALATSVALEAYRENLRLFDAMMQLFRASRAFGPEPLVVAAAGNGSRRASNPDHRIGALLPAAAEDVVSVSAVGPDGGGCRVAEFSNTMASISGPGVGIVSAWPGDALKALDGTSMSCPHVAGIAALWWQKLSSEGRGGAEEVRSRLWSSASRDRLPVGWDAADYGRGLAAAP